MSPPPMSLRPSSEARILATVVFPTAGIPQRIIAFMVSSPKQTSGLGGPEQLRHQCGERQRREEVPPNQHHAVGGGVHYVGDRYRRIGDRHCKAAYEVRHEVI